MLSAFQLLTALEDDMTAVADLRGGAPGARPRPTIFAISCSFFEKFGKFVGWCPLLRGILDPPLDSK